MVNSKRKIRSWLPIWLGDFLSKIYGGWLIYRWRRSGKKTPPPNHLKQQVISDYQKNWMRECLVETGTYQGDMIHAQRNNFNQLISIELNNDFYKRAVKRFEGKMHIKLHQGDSASVLAKIDFPDSSLFWLDAHYSGGDTAKGETECPIFEEFDAINWSSNKPVVLIDDARCFNGTNDYPTIQTLEQYLAKNASGYCLSIEDDIIRIEPGKE